MAVKGRLSEEELDEQPVRRDWRALSRSLASPERQVCTNDSRKFRLPGSGNFASSALPVNFPNLWEGRSSDLRLCRASIEPSAGRPIL
jgi:hypothetical protein